MGKLFPDDLTYVNSNLFVLQSARVFFAPKVWKLYGLICVTSYLLLFRILMQTLTEMLSVNMMAVGFKRVHAQ